MTQAHNPTQNLVQDNKSGMWNARWFVTVAGVKKEKRKSLDTKNLADARKLLKDHMAKVNAVRYGGLPAGAEEAGRRHPVTWGKLVEAFEADKKIYPKSESTRKRYQTSFVAIGGFLHDCDVRPGEIDEGVVKRFVRDREDDDCEPSTIRNDLTAWNRAMKAGVYAEIIPAAAARAVDDYDRDRLGKRDPHDAGPTRPPLGDEMVRLEPELARLSPRLVSLAKFKHRTGCRLKELLMARAEDIRRGEDGTPELWLHRGTKRGKKRTIALNAAAELLPLLPGSGRLFADLPEDVARVSAMWATFWNRRRVAAEAEACFNGDRPLTEWEKRRWRLHDLRHAFAVEALLAGARHDLLALRDHLGHASIKTTEGYLAWARALPVAQLRPLRLFWRGKTEVAGAADSEEQPEISEWAVQREMRLRGESPQRRRSRPPA